MKKTALLIIPFLLVFASCLKGFDEGDCFSFAYAKIEEVTGPQSGTVGQNLQFSVDFTVVNGCGKFEKFEEIKSADTTYIRLIAKYEGCVCTQELKHLDTTYNFRPEKAGNLYLRFVQSETEYAERIITVQ